MAQKHLLHELLQDDQEPFLLKDYIADRRCQLKGGTTTTTPKPHQHHLLQVKKRQPISQPKTSNVFPQNFCQKACFLSFDSSSPDPRKSPLFEFQSPARSPCKSPNAIFLHIPARTASLLLEAALRIQKQSSHSTTKTKLQHNKGTSSFGLFGSLLKKLTHRSGNNKTRKQLKPTTTTTTTTSLKRAASDIHEMGGFGCSCNNGRTSSEVWSESNDGRSLDASSCTSQSEEDLERSFEIIKQVVADHHEIIDFGSYDKHFCESPFHFVLRRSPSSGRRTPDFSSPATSPSRHDSQDRANDDDIEHEEKFQQEEEEDKEQFSPVSVLDPPFEDDDDDGHDDQREDDGFDIECSYAIVLRAKQQLLQKLRRFEKLAELDPVELEKRMLEYEQEDDDDCENDIRGLENEECQDDDLVSLDREKNIDSVIMEQLSETSFQPLRKISRDMKRLVSDLINEEERQQNYSSDGEATVKRVCKRLESWKYVESNTIDMMVEQDFRAEIDAWKRCPEQVEETAFQIELGIFQILVEELAEELAN